MENLAGKSIKARLQQWKMNSRQREFLESLIEKEEQPESDSGENVAPEARTAALPSGKAECSARVFSGPTQQDLLTGNQAGHYQRKQGEQAADSRGFQTMRGDSKL